jgi:enterochelin esterase-like enzyme/outer membrane protein assembly factor BamB
MRIRILALVLLLSLLGEPTRADDWPHWRGPDYDGSAFNTGLFDSAPFHLETEWNRNLGWGYSGIASANDRLFTLFSDLSSDFLIALDPESGEEQWRYRVGDRFPPGGGSQGGPLSSPAVADGTVYGLGPRGRLFALRARDGTEIWSLNLQHQLGATAPYYGFATSPLVIGNTLFVQVGAPNGKSLVGFDRLNGKIRWAVENDAVSYQSPIIATLAGQRQIVAVTKERLLGLDLDSGEVLWSGAHQLDGERAMSSAVPLGSDRLLLAGAHGVAAFQVKQNDKAYSVAEIWRNRELRSSFATPVARDSYVYGFSGDFLTCVAADDGSRQWRSRTPGGNGLTLVDGHLVIIDKTGALVVAEASPEGFDERARLEMFDASSYTYPSFADGKLLVRDASRIGAVVTRGGSAPADRKASKSEPDTAFSRFVRALENADDRVARIDAFMAAQKSFPIVEDERWVHFVYRGEAQDVAVIGSMIEVHANAPMQRVAGTDSFYRTFAIDQGVRWEYHFLVDFETATPDPLNPRRAPLGGDHVSELAMPGWSEPPHIKPYSGLRAGRLEVVEFNSAKLGATRQLQVYLPHGYDPERSEGYPLLVVNDGDGWIDRAGLPDILDHLIDAGMKPVIAAFTHLPSQSIPDEFGGRLSTQHMGMLTEELLPYLDARYALRSDPAARALFGAGLGALMGMYTAVERPDLFGNAGGISVQLIEPLGSRLIELIETAGTDDPASTTPQTRFHILWNRYEMRVKAADFDLHRDSVRLFRTLQVAGFDVQGRELPDSSGWTSWRNYAAEIIFGLIGDQR